MQWQDSADGTLAAEGLLLELGPGARLLRHCLPPAGLLFIPGVVAPERAEARLPEDLQPLASLSAGRRRLLAGEVAVELLRGRLVAGDASETVTRLLLQGPPQAALGLARRLAADLPLRPAACSLAEAALALAEGRPPRARRLGPPQLGGVATAGQGAATAIGHLLEVLLHEAPRCRLERGPEGVHQMRVALRRLRSALKVFRPLADGPALREFDDGLKALARVLGPARDWDVFLSGLGQDLADALPNEPAVARLLDQGTRARDQAYQALRQVLDGPGFRLLLLQGMALAVLPPWPPGARLAPEAPLPDFAAALLRKRWRRFRREGREIASLDDAARHELRLTGKRLRYAAELFAGLWSPRRARRFLRRLARLQDSLGAANDAAVAHDLVASLPRLPGFAAGAVAGFAAARLAPARQAADESWENLMLTEPFWDTD